MKIVNPWSVDENFEYLNMDQSGIWHRERGLLGFDCDIVGVSAGFDTYLEGLGRPLEKRGLQRDRQGHPGRIRGRVHGQEVRPARGGYHPDLGWCIKSFIEGFR